MSQAVCLDDFLLLSRTTIKLESESREPENQEEADKEATKSLFNLGPQAATLPQQPAFGTVGGTKGAVLQPEFSGKFAPGACVLAACFPATDFSLDAWAHRLYFVDKEEGLFGYVKVGYEALQGEHVVVRKKLRRPIRVIVGPPPLLSSSSQEDRVFDSVDETLQTDRDLGMGSSKSGETRIFVLEQGLENEPDSGKISFWDPVMKTFHILLTGLNSPTCLSILPTWSLIFAEQVKNGKQEEDLLHFSHNEQNYKNHGGGVQQKNEQGDKALSFRVSVLAGHWVISAVPETAGLNAHLTSHRHNLLSIHQDLLDICFLWDSSILCLVKTEDIHGMVVSKVMHYAPDSNEGNFGGIAESADLLGGTAGFVGALWEWQDLPPFHLVQDGAWGDLPAGTKRMVLSPEGMLFFLSGNPLPYGGVFLARQRGPDERTATLLEGPVSALTFTLTEDIIYSCPGREDAHCCLHILHSRHFKRLGYLQRARQPGAHLSNSTHKGDNTEEGLLFTTLGWFPRVGPRSPHTAKRADSKALRPRPFRMNSRSIKLPSPDAVDKFIRRINFTRTCFEKTFLEEIYQTSILPMACLALKGKDSILWNCGDLPGTFVYSSLIVDIVKDLFQGVDNETDNIKGVFPPPLQISASFFDIEEGGRQPKARDCLVKETTDAYSKKGLQKSAQQLKHARSIDTSTKTADSALGVFSPSVNEIENAESLEKVLGEMNTPSPSTLSRIITLYITTERSNSAEGLLRLHGSLTFVALKGEIELGSVEECLAESVQKAKASCEEMEAKSHSMEVVMALGYCLGSRPGKKTEAEPVSPAFSPQKSSARSLSPSRRPALRRCVSFLSPFLPSSNKLAFHTLLVKVHRRASHFGLLQALQFLLGSKNEAEKNEVEASDTMSQGASTLLSEDTLSSEVPAPYVGSVPIRPRTPSSSRTQTLPYHKRRGKGGSARRLIVKQQVPMAQRRRPASSPPQRYPPSVSASPPSHRQPNRMRSFSAHGKEALTNEMDNSRKDLDHRRKLRVFPSIDSSDRHRSKSSGLIYQQEANCHDEDSIADFQPLCVSRQRILDSTSLEWAETNLFSPNGELTKRAKQVLSEIFKKYDKQKKGRLTKAQVQALLYCQSPNDTMDSSHTAFSEQNTEKQSRNSKDIKILKIGGLLDFVKLIGKKDPIIIKTVMVYNGYALSLEKNPQRGVGSAQPWYLFEKNSVNTKRMIQKPVLFMSEPKDNLLEQVAFYQDKLEQCMESLRDELDKETYDLQRSRYSRKRIIGKSSTKI